MSDGARLFALAAGRRRQVIRRNFSTAGLGALLFAGSLIAVRLRPGRVSIFLLLGSAGALLLVVGIRRLLLGIRPLRLGRNALWFGTRGISFGQMQAIEVDGERLVIRRGGRRPIEEWLVEPSVAAAAIAGRAGLRPSRRGASLRWERPALEEETK